MADPTKQGQFGRYAGAAVKDPNATSQSDQLKQAAGGYDPYFDPAPKAKPSGYHSTDESEADTRTGYASTSESEAETPSKATHAFGRVPAPPTIPSGHAPAPVAHQSSLVNMQGYHPTGQQAQAYYMGGQQGYAYPAPPAGQVPMPQNGMYAQQPMYGQPMYDPRMSVMTQGSTPMAPAPPGGPIGQGPPAGGPANDGYQYPRRRRRSRRSRRRSDRLSGAVRAGGHHHGPHTVMSHVPPPQTQQAIVTNGPQIVARAEVEMFDLPTTGTPAERRAARRRQRDFIRQKLREAGLHPDERKLLYQQLPAGWNRRTSETGSVDSGRLHNFEQGPDSGAPPPPTPGYVHMGQPVAAAAPPPPARPMGARPSNPPPANLAGTTSEESDAELNLDDYDDDDEDAGGIKNQLCSVLKPHNAVDETELSLRPGDQVTLIWGEPGEQWWYGSVGATYGWFPANKVDPQY